MFWVEASACTRGFVLTICRYKTSRPTVCQTPNTKRGERCKLEFNVSYTFDFTLTWICDSDRHYLVSVQIRFDVQYRHIVHQERSLKRFGKRHEIRWLHLELWELQWERFTGRNGVWLLSAWNKNLGIFASVVCELDVEVVHRFVQCRFPTYWQIIEGTSVFCIEKLSLQLEQVER